MALENKSADMSLEDFYPPQFIPLDIYSGNDVGKDPSFELVLDSAFERLREKQHEYSIRRIDEMECELDELEKELNEILGKRL